MFNLKKLIIGVIILVIGLILKFPSKYESLPLQYRILGLGPYLSEAQYNTVNLISYILIILSLVYIIFIIYKK
ncbi:MAG: hypothetical protein AABX29_03355 [Nanoarchaeota archaeon]|mgnify:CR=1 FL=1